MKRSLTHLIAIGVTLACTSPASASLFNLKKPDAKSKQEPITNYMGVSLLSAYDDSLCQSVDNCNENGRSWKAYSGVRFNDSIMLEGGYINFGEQSGLVEDLTYSQKSRGYTAAATMSHQLTDEIELFGKGGLIWWKTNQSFAGDNQEHSGTDVFYGAGAHYHLGNNMAVRAEWERFDGIPSANQDQPLTIDLLSVGVIFTSL